MLRLRPTFEEIEREARTSRLRILPERQRRTQQGILLDEVDFDDFDLSKYDRKTILINDSNNPEKGTQTDTFNETESESMKTPEEDIKEEIREEEETENTNVIEQQQENEPERERGKSMMRQMLDAMFGEDDALASSGQSRDEFKEEGEELENTKQRIEEEEENEPTVEKQQTKDSDNSLPMNVKKSYEPSSESSSSRRSSNRSVFLPVEEEALSEYINSSQPETVESSNRTIEYVDEATPPQSVISSRRLQETIEYIRSRRSSRASVQSISS